MRWCRPFGKQKKVTTGSEIKKVFRVSLSLLELKDKVKIYIVAISQLFLAILDLAAVTMIGIVSTLSISGIQSKTPPEQISNVVNSLNLQDSTFQFQVAILGSAAAILMIVKTLASVLLVKRMLEFLAHKSGFISANLTLLTMRQPYEYIKRNSSQNILFSVTQGVNSLVIGVVGSLVQIFAESCLIIIMLFGLFIIEPIISLGAMLYFASIAIIQHKVLGKRAVALGSVGAQATVIANQKTVEALSLYREIYTRQGLNQYSNDITLLRQKAALINARLNFLPYINKYTLEISLVLAALILAATQFILVDSMTAVTTLSIFLAAALRVSPAILRLQQSFLGIKSSTGSASPTLKLIEDIAEQEKHSNVQELSSNGDYEIQLKNVSFEYQDAAVKSIEDMSFTINRGEMIALIGPSGGGKTTLVDLILGLLEPQSGEIVLRGMAPKHFIELAPGKVGYVAQDSSLINGSVRENLIFGLKDKFSDNQLLEVLDKVALRDFVLQLPNQLEEAVGDRGTLLSGGQRQRLNLARAILTEPEILILDEATSALDVETEHQIVQAIESIRNHRTIVVIAHRLSTILNADKILFIKAGKLLGEGTFQELREKVSDFDYQANLAGYTK